MDAKTLGESNLGQQYQSIVPSLPARATVGRAPPLPRSAIGRYSCMQHYSARVRAPASRVGWGLLSSIRSAGAEDHVGATTGSAASRRATPKKARPETRKR